MEKEVKVKGIYKHYKGDFYLVEEIAFDSETTEKLVIYRALYGNTKLWVRPYQSFVEKVQKNGQTYRFELQDIESKNQSYQK